MRDHLLASLRDRIRRYAETGDASIVLGNDTSLEIDALIGPRTGFDNDAARTAAELRWLRYQAGPDGAGGNDLAEALRLYELLLANGIKDVPGPLLLILECRDDP